MKKGYHGLYEVENKDKYIGNTNPKYRSSWEAIFCYFLDHSKSVVKWGYECVNIRYYSPIDKKLHRYFIDFYFESINKHGKLEKYLVEVKPSEQTKPPKRPKNKNKKRNKRYLAEMETFIINKCKWKSAMKFCAARGIKWKIITEHEIFA
jgi:hypothetical protein